MGHLEKFILPYRGNCHAFTVKDVADLQDV
jgi:hypothetical protein